MHFPGDNDALRGRRVLVIEDEMLVAMEFESVLQAHGCVVVGPAASIEQASVLLHEQRPDVALMDLNLNGQSALPVAAALREKAVPFVLVTGYSESRSAEPELRQAPRLPKPVRHRDLLQTLAELLTPSGGAAGRR
jgi:CheY-like chemotaxis protein